MEGAQDADAKKDFGAFLTDAVGRQAGISPATASARLRLDPGCCATPSRRQTGEGSARRLKCVCLRKSLSHHHCRPGIAELAALVQKPAGERWRHRSPKSVHVSLKA
jgi:hypothetical protein